MGNGLQLLDEIDQEKPRKGLALLAAIDAERPTSIEETEDRFQIPVLSLGFIEQPRVVSGKAERASFLKPSSVQQRVEQASEFLTTTQMREHEQQLIRNLQSKIDRGEQIDPLQMAYYQEYLDIPEPKTEMRVPEKRETLTAKGWMPASKVVELPKEEMPKIDLATGDILPPEPEQEKPLVSPVEAFKEQWKTSAYQSSQSAYAALQQMGLSTISGIMDLNKKIPTPQFIKNIRNKVANTIGYDIEGIEQKAREKIDDLILDTALYRKQIGDEIRKEGGMAAEVAQNIGDEFLSSAVTLSGLGALKLIGNAPTIRESLKAAAKLVGITYATTEGDSLDRARAATGAGLFMLTPIPSGRMAKNWSAKLVNTALNFGVDLFTGRIGQAVTEAKNKAIEKGTPEKWKEELTTTLTPALLLEGAFGLLARAKTPPQVKQVKALYNELPPEILDSIKKVSPKMRAEWEKAVETETKLKEPERIELPIERRIEDAAEKRKIKEGDLGKYRGTDAQREAAEAGRGDRIQRGGIEPEAPGEVAEVGKLAEPPIIPEKVIKKPSEMPPEAVKTIKGIPEHPPTEVGAEKAPELMTPDQKYDASLETFRQANRDFTKIQKAYRAKQIGDTEFLAGKKMFDDAMVIADVAETAFIESKKQPPLPPPAPTTPKEEIETPAPVKAWRTYDQKIEEGRAETKVLGKPPELMTPDEFKNVEKDIIDGISTTWRSSQETFIDNAIHKRKPILAESWDKLRAEYYEGKLPVGYIKEGDQYVYKPPLPPLAPAGEPGTQAKVEARVGVSPSEEKAIEFSNDPKNLTKRLKWHLEFRGIQNRKDWKLDMPNKRLISPDGSMAVVWKIRKFPDRPESYENQQTSQGDAEIVKLVEPAKPTLEEKEFITKPLAEIKKVAIAQDIEVADKSRKQIVDELQTKQSETAKEKILDDLPVSEELKRKPGLRNMAGAIGVEKPLRIDTSVINDAADMQRVFDKQRSDIEAKLKTPLSKIRDEVSANLFGTDIPITRRLMEANGRDVVMAKVASRGWGEKTELDIQDALADIKATIPHKLDYAFNDFLQARRTIEVSNLMREKRGTQSELFAEGELPEVILSPGGKGAKANREWMNEFQKQYPKEFKAMKEAGEKRDNTMKGVVDEYLAEGLIDKEFHDYLIKNHPHFSPRKFLQHIDPEISVQIQGKKISVPDSGIQALDVGSEKSLVNDSSFLLADVLSRKNSRIAKNRANKALYEYASENKDNPLGIRILSAEEAEKKISAELSTVSVMIDGKPKVMVGDANLIKYWHEASPALNQQTANIIKTLSGVKIVKALATGYNPAFALYNIPRDIQHYWYVATAYGGTGYSRHLPIALAQITKDIIKVMPDAVGRKGRYRDYINEGGGMGLLTTQGRLGRSPYGYSTIRNETLRQIERVGSWLPETSEILTRLAIREREIRSGKTSKEATYIARQVLDFSQGGKLIKTMDNFVPYLNAAMQATRGTLDAWRYSPKEALYKTAQLIALGAIGAILRKRLNEKTDDAIPDSERVAKWNFPLPYYKIDKNGNKRYFYIPVPKEQAQQIFSIIGEELARKAMGEKVSFQRLRMAFANLSPVDISNMPPLLAAILTYVMNKDFWSKDDVWKGREVSPSKEYYPTTPEAWKKVGEVTGLSPERLRKSAGKLIPNNPFIQLFGGLQSPIEYSKDDAIMQKMFTLISQTPVINRYLKVTPSVDLTEDEIRKAEKYGIKTAYPDGDIKPRHIIRELIKEKETEVNDLRQLSDYKMDIMIGQIKNKKLNVEELHKWLESLDVNEFKRLTTRLKKKYPEGM